MGARLGQNFLANKGIVKAIADIADISTQDVVLEIGPGKGILTVELLERAKKVTAVEKDSALVTKLKSEFESEIKSEKLLLIENDVRDFNLSTVGLDEMSYKLVANIPYYITGEIIRQFLEAENQPETMTLLVQKEVAERIVARPEPGRGAKDGKESVLSISVKAYGSPKYAKTVKKGSFKPIPKVDSAVLHIENISKKRFDKTSPEDFFTLLKAGFSSKRKTLANNLKEYDREAVLRALIELGLDEKVRPERLSTLDWFALAERLCR